MTIEHACGISAKLAGQIEAPRAVNTGAVTDASCERLPMNENATPARKLYAYRLHVTYPEGVDWRNPPEAWERDYGDPNTSFDWPRVHPYLSRSGAKARADLLTKYGCTVTIERSDPITWGGE